MLSFPIFQFILKIDKIRPYKGLTLETSAFESVCCDQIHLKGHYHMSACADARMET